MVLLTIFQKILKVVVVVRHFLECEILTESLPQVKNFKVLSLRLSKFSSVYLSQLRHLSNSTHTHIRIAKLLTYRVALYIQ